MSQKNKLRKQYYKIRKKRYYEINKDFFIPLTNLIKSKIKKKIKLGLYYPSNYEVNILKILEDDYVKSLNLFLPVIKKNNQMNFFKWKKNQVLFVNKFGMLEPSQLSVEIPNLILVPILAFDKNKFRLGYGKGFYDRYLHRFLKNFQNIITVGVAFSFQKYHKLPTNSNDVKLNYILTEKGIF
jgi:5-formyltetrahydrofolate cyclo-ligase